MAEQVDSPSLYREKGDPSQAVGGVDAPRQEQGDTEIVSELRRGYDRAKNYKYTQSNPRDWRRFAMIYNDQHWDGTQEAWQSTPTINLTFAAINAILPIITDSRPQIAVVPREPDDAQIADVIRSVVEWLWEKNNCDVILPKTMLNTLIFGNGFWKLMWDGSQRNGLGDIKVLNVDPTHIFVNAEATSFDDIEEVYHVEQIPLKLLKRMYPDQPMPKPGVLDGTVLIHRPNLAQGKSNARGSVDVATTSGSDVYTFPSGSTSKTADAPKNTVTVIERWMIDEETGRWRKTVIAMSQLMEDGIQADVETPPFVQFVDYPTAWGFWATGEVQHVENLQYEINKRRGMILDTLRFCSQPMLVADPSSGVDIDTIEARPGVIIPAEGGPSAVGWLAPQMDLAGLFGVQDRDKQDFNDILGNVDVIQGKRPVGIEAAAAIEALAESANTRLRLKVRLMESSLRRAGDIMVKLIQKHYTTPRLFRIIGRDFYTNGGSASGQAMPAASSEFIGINQPNGMDESGQMQFQNQIPPDAEFDIKIGAGSTLPVSRTARFQQAITLYDRGCIDRQEVLKHAAWPRWEEVEARMAQAEQAQQQMEMQMGGGGGGGGGQMPGANPAAAIPDDVSQMMGPQGEGGEPEMQDPMQDPMMQGM